LEYALAQALECPGTVTLEGEEVLAGPEDRLDALTDRREVWSGGVGFVFAAGSEDRGVQFADFVGELTPGVTLVTDQGLPARALTASEQLDGDLARSSCLGEVSASALGVPSGAKIACSLKPQKNRECDADQP
jgi:hypothetical protein